MSAAVKELVLAGSELKGKTLGIVGLGAIGFLVADMALALGMNVVGFEHFPKLN